ncbi:SUN domain-containing protein 3-like isoform X2 [Ambystoma mexicanum]|uniref:SUN domain-containing protein 3-like isoform X2 n=1 Tax=Ambystoma mexicanum TaxID=8296 RepID=UPI0037E83011
MHQERPGVKTSDLQDAYDDSNSSESSSEASLTGSLLPVSQPAVTRVFVNRSGIQSTIAQLGQSSFWGGEVGISSSSSAESLARGRNSPDAPKASILKSLSALRDSNQLADKPWLQRNALLALLVIKFLFTTARGWFGKACKTFARCIGDFKSVVILLLILGYWGWPIDFPGSLSKYLYAIEQKEAQIRTVTFHEWQEENQRCKSTLETLKHDYRTLNGRLLPLQEELQGLHSEIGFIKKTAHEEARNVVEDALYRQRALGAVSEQQVLGLVNNAVKRLQEDHIQVPDYALKSAGASILRSRTSESYETNTAQMRWHNFAFWNYSPDPDIILQPDVNPGNCWAFPGAEGHATVKLAENICPVAVTIQHIPRAISHPGDITSAPKDFAIYGLNEDMEEEITFLGEFTYDSEGDPIQTFQLVEGNSDNFKYIQLRVLSNWGNPDYTCIYRFRVHRELPKNLHA